MEAKRTDESFDVLKAAGAVIIGSQPVESAWDVHIEHIPQLTTPEAKRRPGKDGIADTTSTASPSGDWSLPPWGQFPQNLWDDILPLIPLDFMLPNGAEPNLGNYRDWLLDVVSDIDEFVWPKITSSSTSWSGARIRELLDADFLLLHKLRRYFGYPIDYPDRRCLPTTVQHCELFAQEDDLNVCFGAAYNRYDTSLTAQICDSLPTIMTAGIADKVGSIDLQLKLVFQRPRAYQVAYIQRRSGFTYEAAKTSGSPSLVSGHCLQASIAGCSAFNVLKSHIGRQSLEILQQFTVDIGDRRVFAGVHYPSDNLSSWMTAFKLIPFVFGSKDTPSVRSYLWQAIDSKSIVFRNIKAHVQSTENSPYKAAVEHIRWLGSGE